MEQRPIPVLLDSNVVIDLIEGRRVAGKRGIRTGLKGKSVCIVICDVVLREVHRIRGFAASFVVSRISMITGRRVELSSTNDRQRALAKYVTRQYRICHRGDDLILAQCKANGFVLVTRDRMLRQTCDIMGVPAFHPSNARGHLGRLRRLCRYLAPFLFPAYD